MAAKKLARGLRILGRAAMTRLALSMFVSTVVGLSGNLSMLREARCVSCATT